MFKGRASHLFSGNVESNCTVTPLAAGGAFVGDWETADGIGSLDISSLTDQAGTLYFEQSQDTAQVDQSQSFSVAASTIESQRVAVSMRHYRIRLVNDSASPQTQLRLQVRASSWQSQGALGKLSASTQADAIGMLTKAFLVGEQDSGDIVPVRLDGEGHITTALHSPRLPFGSIHVENLRPMFQTDGVYGVNSGQVSTDTTLTGTAVGSGGLLQVATGTTAGARAAIQSRKRLRYRAGQGSIARFTAMFSAPAADSKMSAGLSQSEDGLCVGYNGLSFGVCYATGGTRETQTLTLTTPSSTSENCTITLGGVATAVAITNSANLNRTAYEISRGTYPGWQAEPVGTTVVFVSKAAGNVSGTFSLSATTAAGTFAETRPGVAPTETWIYQADWNGDKLDGTGPSGFTINPQKLNVFQIHMQYLGAGCITFFCEVTHPERSNPAFVPIHTLKFPNTLTAPTLKNPALPIRFAAESLTSTTNVSVSTASFAGFIEGERHVHGNRFSYFNQSTLVGATNYQALTTVQNGLSYGSRANQAVINILSVSAAIKHTSPVTIYLMRNATLAGNPNFSAYSASSCSRQDVTATTATISDNAQIIWSGSMGETGDTVFAFSDDITIQPGESVTVAAKSSAGTPSYVLASLNTREDQ